MEISIRDATRSVVRTVAGTFDFGGRARIVDVGWYWFASMIAGFLIGLPLDLLPWDVQWFADRTVQIAFALPLFALFARRLHDQGLSGWWTLLLVPLPPISLYQSYRAVFAIRNPAWLGEPDPAAPLIPWLAATVLVMLVLFLRPGMRGPNRYGPDPREAPAYGG